MQVRIIMAGCYVFSFKIVSNIYYHLLYVYLLFLLKKGECITNICIINIYKTKTKTKQEIGVFPAIFWTPFYFIPSFPFFVVVVSTIHSITIVLWSLICYYLYKFSCTMPPGWSTILFKKKNK